MDETLATLLCTLLGRATDFATLFLALVKGEIGLVTSLAGFPGAAEPGIVLDDDGSGDDSIAIVLPLSFILDSSGFSTPIFNN